MGLKFDYTPKLTDRGIDRSPLVDIVFINPKNGKSIEVTCLIDSGADDTILNGAFADELGIDLKSGRSRPFQGIAYDPVIGYEHMLTIKLKQDTHKFTIACSFLPELKAAGLLGQNGFFDNYKILFERYKKRFELTPQT